MNNLIQFIIAAVLSSLGFAEEVEVTSTSVGPHYSVEITTTSVSAFLPTEEIQWYECENIFYFSPTLIC